jgi:hypothetical protein
MVANAVPTVPNIEAGSSVHYKGSKVVESTVPKSVEYGVKLKNILFYLCRKYCRIYCFKLISFGVHVCIQRIF